MVEFVAGKLCILNWVHFDVILGFLRFDPPRSAGLSRIYVSVLISKNH